VTIQIQRVESKKVRYFSARAHMSMFNVYEYYCLFTVSTFYIYLKNESSSLYPFPRVCCVVLVLFFLFFSSSFLEPLSVRF